MSKQSKVKFQRNYFDEGYHLLEHPETDAGLFLDNSDVDALKQKQGTQLWFHVISRLTGGRQFLEKAVGSNRNSDLKPNEEKVKEIIQDLAKQLNNLAQE